MPPPIPTPIYHITAVDNLPSILSGGGLGSCNWLANRGSGYTSIAHQTIQAQRGSTPVPCGTGGTVHDYVPFYFAPRSPMLCAIHNGKVEQYTQGQEPVIHLVTTAQTIEGASIGFVFTDGHSIMAFTEFFDDLARLDRVDWALMRGRYWNDTVEYPDRKRRRQAEFLVHTFCPWNLVTEIGVINAQMKDRAMAAIDGATHKPIVSIYREWYY